MFTRQDKEFFRKHARALKQLWPFVALGLILPLVLIFSHTVDTKWFILGPVTWAVAIGIKSIPFFLSIVFPRLANKIKNLHVISVLEGLLSALAELGLTILFFWYNLEDLDLKTILSFGLGIGFAEVLLVLYLILEEIDRVTEDLTGKAKRFVLWRPFFERLLAIAGHVFSRAIVGLAMLPGGNLLFVLPAFLSFGFIDGWAGYITRKWDMEDPIVLRRINLIHGATVLFEALVLLYLFLTMRSLSIDAI